MGVVHSKVTLGVLISLFLVFATNTARADDPSGGGTFQFHNPPGTGVWPNTCVDLEHGSLNNGAQLVERPCNSSSAAGTQAWYYDANDCIYVPNENGSTAYCSIRSKNNRCVGTYGGSGNPGTYAVIWDCLGQSHPDQYWTVSYTGTSEIWNYKSPNLGLTFVGTTQECGFLCQFNYQIGLGSDTYDYNATPATP